MKNSISCIGFTLSLLLMTVPVRANPSKTPLLYVPRDTSFSLITYNVAALLDPGADVRMVQIGDRLNGYDVALVQEAFVNRADFLTHEDALRAAVNHDYVTEPQEIPQVRGRGVLVNDGLHQFSHFAFDEVIRQTWQACMGPDCSSSKGFSFTRTELAPGVTVDIYNLHMQAENGLEASMVRRDNVIQLLEFIEENSEGQAVIVAGDTNLQVYPYEYYRREDA